MSLLFLFFIFYSFAGSTKCSETKYEYFDYVKNVCMCLCAIFGKYKMSDVLKLNWRCTLDEENKKHFEDEIKKKKHRPICRIQLIALIILI